MITLRPNKIWCDFLNEFKRYKVFMIVDDNSFNIDEFSRNYENITFIKIENEKCLRAGYKNTSFVTLYKAVTGWDKALYYFGKENTCFEHIWFLEDDIFFYNEKTLSNIDDKYKDDDMLSSVYNEYSVGAKNTWLWSRFNINFERPLYCGMMCTVRFSKNMMTHIDNYAVNNNTLTFLEALFPTVAIKYNLKYKQPDEFKHIYWRHEFKKEDINSVNLYHPVKNINCHVSYRNASLRLQL